MGSFRQPLVTVLIPCFNYAAYVADAIKSVLEQDYPCFEVVVIDDGSTDSSLQEIEKAVAAYQPRSLAVRVEVISQINQGVSAALNAGLAAARGKYIATFDADDLMPPGRLSLQVDYLDRNPEVGCLGGLAIRIDEAGELLPKKSKRRAVKRYTFDEALASALVVGGNIAVYRRDAMEKAGGYDPTIRVQDFQMTLRVAHAGYYVDILPEVVTLYRKHEGSLSKDYKSEYRYGLQVIQGYATHPLYGSAKARLITKALRAAVTDDKRFAWGLLREVPLKEWDRQLLKRLRHLLFKSSRRASS